MAKAAAKGTGRSAFSNEGASKPNRLRRKRRSFWLDASCTEISFRAYFFVKLYRMPWESFSRRSSFNDVHSVDVVREHVPLPVWNFLGKSLKLVPNERAESFRCFTARIDPALNSLRWKVRLGNGEPKHGGNDARSLICPAGKLPPKLPSDSMTILSMFSFGLRSMLADRWPSHYRPTSNLTRGDRWALRWLHEHRADYAAVDTDKNLGVALVSRQWLNDQLSKHSCSDVATLLSAEQVQQQLHEVSAALHDIVHSALQSDILVAGNVRYLLANISSQRLPCLRVNVKVHKNPIESRPILNTRGTILQPLAVFVNAALLDVQKSCTHVVQSSSAVVDFLSHYTGPQVHQLCTFDVCLFHTKRTISC